MIKVYSDGSHSAPVNMTEKPVQTKGAVIFLDEEGVLIDQYTRLGSEGWSDVAEYLAVVLGLEKLLELGFNSEDVEWFNDNQFVVNYLRQRKAGNPRKDYYPLSLKAIELLKHFKSVKFHWIPREKNERADELSKL